MLFKDFPGGSGGKASAYNAGDLGLIPGSGRSPGEGNGNPLQYSCLENPMDRGAWLATCPWGHKESDTTEWFHLSDSLNQWLVIHSRLRILDFVLGQNKITTEDFRTKK